MQRLTQQLSSVIIKLHFCIICIHCNVATTHTWLHLLQVQVMLSGCNWPIKLQSRLIAFFWWTYAEYIVLFTSEVEFWNLTFVYKNALILYPAHSKDLSSNGKTLDWSTSQPQKDQEKKLASWIFQVIDRLKEKQAYWKWEDPYLKNFINALFPAELFPVTEHTAAASCSS